MKLIPKLVEKLPKLTWIAQCDNLRKEVSVMHGRYVETGKDYCIAAVWDGEFSETGIDKTDIIAGTGIKIRDDKAIFVTPANPLDRISYYKTDNGFLLSNSLPAIFALADLAPLKEFDYEQSFQTIIKGLYKYDKTIPTSKNEVHLIYFNNLVYDGVEIKEIEKPDCVPHFHTFDDYNSFLFGTAARISKNAFDENRKAIIEVVSTCSSGYDSSLATVIGKRMGSKKVLSIANASSLLKHSDSGEKVAAALGVPCEVKSSIRENYKNEEAIWVSMGTAIDLHLTVFDFPQPLSLMLTAFHGDMMWERTPFDLTEFLHRHDPSGASFSEWALREGVIQMSIGFWAIRRGKEIQSLSKLEEMNPWTLYNNYDRPVPRRIIETAGIRRGDFALAKRVATISSDWLPKPRPFSKDLLGDFKQFAKQEGIKIPSSFSVNLWRVYNALHWHIFRRIGLIFKNEDLLKIFWAPFKTRWIFFYWAMHKVKKNYQEILNSVE